MRPRQSLSGAVGAAFQPISSESGLRPNSTPLSPLACIAFQPISSESGLRQEKGSYDLLDVLFSTHIQRKRIATGNFHPCFNDGRYFSTHIQRKRIATASIASLYSTAFDTFSTHIQRKRIATGSNHSPVLSLGIFSTHIQRKRIAT